MTKAFYREKSPTVEAYRFSVRYPFPEFLHVALLRGDVWYQGGDDPYVTVKAADGGTMRARVGDWIVRSIDHSDIRNPEPTYGPLQVLSTEMFAQRYVPDGK